jgi:uncharacterized protein (DUF2267 family)
MRYASFVTTVERLSDLSRPASERAIEATLRTLSERISGGEAQDIAAFVPQEVRAWLTSAPEPAEPFDRQELIRRVAELLHADRDPARRATEAVLQTLAVRISAGEVDDLEDELPADLHAALERGLVESRAAKPMREQEFVARVAALEGVSPEEAERHAHAVFQALREALSNKEFSDMAAQLSEDYAPLLV